MKKKFAIVLALFLIAVVCSAGCIDPETPVDPVDPVVPVDPVTPVDPVDPVVPVEEYSVMFMLNYGDAGAYTAETVKAGETVSKPATPTRSGYTFKGWFTAAEGGAEYDFTQAVNADVTLYAQWKKKSSSSSSSSSSSGSTNSNAHLQGTTVTPSIGNAVTGDGSSTSVTGTVEETSGNTVVTVTDPSGVKMDVTYEPGSVTSNDGKTVTGTVSSVTVTYPEKDAGTASADSPDALSSLQLELTKAVGTLPTIDSGFKQDVSSKIKTKFSGDKPLAMITASNTEQVNSGAIKEDGLAITFKLTGLSDEDKTKLVGYHVSGDDVETVTPESVTSTGDTTTVVLKGDSFSSWAVGIAEECRHNDLKLIHDEGTTFDKATHSGSCGDCNSAVTNEKCAFTETSQDGGSILYECSKCGYQYSKAGSEMNLDSVTIPEDGTITSAAQLFKLAQLVNAGDDVETVTLGIDIDLAGVEWTPIGTSTYPFSGTFDGQGYTIKGLTNKEEATSFGLFEKVSGTVVIKNFDLYVDAVASEALESEGWAGVVGMSDGKQCDLTLDSIKVYGTLTADDKVAGIIAQAPTYKQTNSKLTVKNCENYAAVTGTRAAGICCSINNYNDYANTFENCVNHGTITATEGKYRTAAGILCKNEAGTVFTECKNEGTLDASIAYNIATKLVITFDPTTYRAGAVRANAADVYYYTMSNPDVESMYDLFKGEPYSADTAVDWEEVVRTSNSIDLTGLGAGVWYDTENDAEYLVTVTTKKATPNGEVQKYYKTLKAFKTLDEALSHSLDGAEVTLKATQEMNYVLTSGVEDATGIFKTLDLNGYTLTMKGNITVNGNGLTIKNGTITHNADDELFVLTGAGVPGVVTFDNVTLNAPGKCIAKIGASFAGALNYNEYSSISGYIDLTGNPATELTINENTYFQTDGRYVVITNNDVTRKSSL